MKGEEVSTYTQRQLLRQVQEEFRFGRKWIYRPSVVRQGKCLTYDRLPLFHKYTKNKQPDQYNKQVKQTKRDASRGFERSWLLKCLRFVSVRYIVVELE